MRRFLTILALTVCLSASAWSSTDPQFGNVSPSLYTGGTLKPLRYITDRIGSVALLIDLDTAPSQEAASIRERNYSLPYGTHLTATGFAGEASSRWR